MTRRLTIPLLVTVALICTLGIFQTANAVTCTVAGTVPITPTKRQVATDAGIPTNQECWDPTDQSIGQSAGEAKRYLDSMPKRCTTVSPGCQAPPDTAHIMKLNDTMAKCAAKFFQEYTKQYGPLIMSSGYRDGASGENSRAGGADNSNHTRGVAIDVYPGGGKSSHQTLWSFASNNPKFGVCFPHQDGGANTTGYNDPPHMILAGIGGKEAAACAKQGVTKPCDGLPFVPSPASQIATAPTNRFQQAMNGLQNLFAPPQPQQCPAGYMMLNGQCLPPQAQAAMQQPSPFSYGSQSPSPVPTGSSGGSPVPTGGSSGSVTTGSSVTIGSNVAANGTGGTTDISGLLDSSGKPKKGTSTSAIDLIGAIANPTTTVGTATGTTIGTSVALNSSLKQGVVLNAAGQNPSTISPSSTYALNPIASQTFVSDDLSKTPVQNFGMTNASTFGILENMKRILLSVLQLLRPFGGTVPSANLANSTTAYME